METRYHEVISRYLLKTIEENKQPTLRDFVKEEGDFIAEHTDISEPSFMETWSTRFGRVAQELNISVARSRQKVDWGSVAVKMILHAANSSRRDEPCDQSSSIASSSNRSGSSRSSSKSQSSKTDSVLLNEATKRSYVQKFTELDPTKKWVLPSGTVVEDEMYRFGLECMYEHPVHSWVLNADDPCWRSVFSNEDFTAILEKGQSSLPAISTGARKMMDALKIPDNLEKEEDIIKQIWKTATDFGFVDPVQHFEEDWIQMTILNILSYYRWNFIQKLQQGSEMDLIVYLWSLLDRAFHQLHIDTKRDRLCMATSARVNEERVVMGTKPVTNKNTSVRPDLVLIKNGVEYGVSESGKKDEAAMTKKELIETQLLCPKTMKDMFDRAASKLDSEEALIHELRIVCMNQTGFRFRLSVMDCPAGYVCRMMSSKEYQVPVQACMIPSKLLPILELTLQAKSIVHSSIQLIEKHLKDKSSIPQDFAFKFTPQFSLPHALTIHTTPNKRKADILEEV